MENRTRLALIAAGAVAVILLFVLLRPDGDDDDSAASPATTSEPATTTAPAATTTVAETTTTPATTTEPPPKPEPNVLRVTVRGGRPAGGIQRATVEKGDQVRIVVRSDVADHVHLHGYDVMRDVAPGAPAQLALRATLTGRFEIELEDRGLQIAELEVRP